MKPLNQIDLDMAAAHGCSHPECDHSKHDGTIFLHGQCHQRARVLAKHGIKNDVVYLSCIECGQAIIKIQSSAPIDRIDLENRCHPGAGVDASYTLRSGVVKIVCAICHKPIADISVIPS